MAIDKRVPELRALLNQAGIGPDTFLSSAEQGKFIKSELSMDKKAAEEKKRLDFEAARDALQTSRGLYRGFAGGSQYDANAARVLLAANSGNSLLKAFVQAANLR